MARFSRDEIVNIGCHNALACVMRASVVFIKWILKALRDRGPRCHFFQLSRKKWQQVATTVGPRAMHYQSPRYFYQADILVTAAPRTVLPLFFNLFDRPWDRGPPCLSNVPSEWLGIVKSSQKCSNLKVKRGIKFC